MKTYWLLIYMPQLRQSFDFCNKLFGGCICGNIPDFALHRWPIILVIDYNHIRRTLLNQYHRTAWSTNCDAFANRKRICIQQTMSERVCSNNSLDHANTEKNSSFDVANQGKSPNTNQIHVDFVNGVSRIRKHFNLRHTIRLKPTKFPQLALHKHFVELFSVNIA